MRGRRLRCRHAAAAILADKHPRRIVESGESAVTCRPLRPLVSTGAVAMEVLTRNLGAAGIVVDADSAIETPARLAPCDVREDARQRARVDLADLGGNAADHVAPLSLVLRIEQLVSPCFLGRVRIFDLPPGSSARQQ